MIAVDDPSHFSGFCLVVRGCFVECCAGLDRSRNVDVGLDRPADVDVGFYRPADADVGFDCLGCRRLDHDELDLPSAEEPGMDLFAVYFSEVDSLDLARA